MKQWPIPGRDVSRHLCDRVCSCLDCDLSNESRKELIRLDGVPSHSISCSLLHF